MLLLGPSRRGRKTSSPKLPRGSLGVVFRGAMRGSQHPLETHDCPMSGVDGAGYLSARQGMNITGMSKSADSFIAGSTPECSAGGSSSSSPQSRRSMRPGGGGAGVFPGCVYTSPEEQKKRYPSGSLPATPPPRPALECGARQGAAEGPPPGVSHLRQAAGHVRAVHRQCTRQCQQKPEGSP